MATGARHSATMFSQLLESQPAEITGKSIVQFSAEDLLNTIQARAGGFSYSRLTHGFFERVGLGIASLQSYREGTSFLTLLDDSRLAPKYRRSADHLLNGISQFFALYPEDWTREFIKTHQSRDGLGSRLYGLSVSNGSCALACELEILTLTAHGFPHRDFSLEIANGLLEGLNVCSASLPKELILDGRLRSRFVDIVRRTKVVIVSNEQTYDRVASKFPGATHVRIPDLPLAPYAIGDWKGILAKTSEAIQDTDKTVVLVEAGHLSSLLCDQSRYPAELASHSFFLDLGRALPLLSGQARENDRWVNKSFEIRNTWGANRHANDCLLSRFG